RGRLEYIPRRLPALNQRRWSITETRLWSVWLFLLLFGFVSLKIGIGNLRLYNRYKRGDPPQMRPNEDALTLLKIPTEQRKLTPSPANTTRSKPASIS